MWANEPACRTRQPAVRSGWRDVAGWAAVGAAFTLAPPVAVWIVVRTLALGGVTVSNPAAIIACLAVSWLICILSVGVVAEVLDEH